MGEGNQVFVVARGMAPHDPSPSRCVLAFNEQGASKYSPFPPPTIPDKWSYFLGLYNLISVSTTDLPINAIDHMTRMGKKEHDFQKISNKKTVKCNEKRNDC